MSIRNHLKSLRINVTTPSNRHQQEGPPVSTASRAWGIRASQCPRSVGPWGFSRFHAAPNGAGWRSEHFGPSSRTYHSEAVLRKSGPAPREGESKHANETGQLDGCDSGGTICGGSRAGARG